MIDSKIKNLLSNTAIFSLGSISAKVIMFLFLPLYTNILSVSEYGIVELITTTVELIVPILSLNIGDAILRYGLSKASDKNEIINCAIFVLLVGSIALLLISPFFSLFDSVKSYSIYLVMLAILSSFRVSFQYYSKAIGKNNIFAFDSFVFSFTLAITNVLFLVVFKLSLNGYFISNIVSSCVSVLFLFFACCINKVVKNFSLNKELLKKMLQYSIPLIVNSLSWWVIHSTDKYMLNVFLSEESVGIFGVASKIPSLINTITYFFSQAWIIAAITEYESTRDNYFYSRVFRFFNFVLCSGVSLLLIVLKPFMHFFIGNAFGNSWLYVPILLMATVFRNYSDYFGAFYSSAKKNKTVAITTASGALFNIVLNYLLIPRIGIWGATISTCLSYFVVAFYRIVASRKFMHIRLYCYELIPSLVLILISVVSLSTNSYTLWITISSFVLLLFVNSFSIKKSISIICSLSHKKHS